MTVVVRGLPDGNSVRPRLTATDTAVPAVPNVTFAKHPARFVVEADSWSVPVVPLVGCVNVNDAVPFAVVVVKDPPVGPPSMLPVVPACDSVMLRPLSVVTVCPLLSWTVTVIVELWVEPATTLAGLAAHPSFEAAPTADEPGTVIRQKMP